MESKLIFFLALGLMAACASAQDCGLCDEMTLDSTGGIDEEYSRYTGTWVRQGLWEGRPFYICSETCQGLRDNLIFYDGEWRIVDCKPDAPGACDGSHTMIVATNSGAFPNSCPYDDIGPWNYCDGDLIVGGACTHYSTDETAQFSCTSVNPSKATNDVEE